MKRIFSLIILTIVAIVTKAQINDFGDNGFNVSDDGRGSFNSHAKKDTVQHKKIPKGMYVWTIDRLFGDRIPVDRDTIQHLFMNTTFTEGMYGQYNTTGNLGAPRINRIVTDRRRLSDFHFADPFDHFVTPVDELRFTNTLSPITNLTYNSCGDQLTGEDHLNVKYAVNANKRLGAGMKFDYVYGRGYYSSQSTALFDWTFWTSYLGERYQAHFTFSTDHMKISENGGISNDEYITHPESFSDNFTPSEIPTILSSNWNQIEGLHAYLTHRYNVGFYKKVPMTESEKEARRFALASKKEHDEKESTSKRTTEDKDKPLKTFSGRPDDAKVMGDLPVDSLGKVDSERIKVIDGSIADSLVAKTEDVKEDTSWMKEEYVPVTSFIHTIQFDKYERNYHSKKSPTDFYLNSFKNLASEAEGYDYDPSNSFKLRNTFAIGMLEGFNKWAKAGLKVFAAHELLHYELPDSVKPSTSYNESTLFIGGQLVKTQGSIFHYNAVAELGVVGQKFGDLTVDVNGEVNIPLFGDTTSVLVNGFFHRTSPAFLMTHYHSSHFWWDNNDLKSQIHTHLEGKLNINKTNTTLRLAYDNIENYAYFGMSYDRNPSNNLPVNYQVGVRQTSKNINLLTAELYQDFRLGILNWENRITFQQCSEQEILPVPKFNAWTNLYLNFKIAKVLSCHFGAEAIYFTEYDAPEYTGQLASYAVQENADVRTKVGNYPFVNVYANFVLKGCRFYAMMSHVNAGNGSKNYFTTPHHPMNDSIFRIGLSWNFYN